MHSMGQRTFHWLLLLSVLATTIACPTIIWKTEDPILRSGDFIERDGFVLIQQFNGALELYKGNASKLECLIWDSPINECTSDAGGEYSFLTKLQGDANIVVNIVDESTGRKKPYWSCFGDEDCNAFIYDAGVFYGNIQMQVNCDGSLTVSRGGDELYSFQRNYGCIIEPPVCQDLKLMDQTTQVTSEMMVGVGDGAFMRQSRDGTFSVYAGTLEKPGVLLWQNCPTTFNTTFSKVTTLQSDGVLYTYDTGLFSVVYATSEVRDFDGPWSFYLVCGDAAGEWDTIMIRNDEGRVIFEEPLFTSNPPKAGCDLEIPLPILPSCPTATILLEGSESVRQEDGMVVRGDYTLAQTTRGVFQVWRGSSGTFQCIVFETDPDDDVLFVFDSYTKMQQDGNLVTYIYNAMEDGFVPFWATGSNQEPANVAIPSILVAGDCRGNGEELIIYDNDPTRMEAKILWSTPLTDCSPVPTIIPSSAPSKSPSSGGGKYSNSRRSRTRRLASET